MNIITSKDFKIFPEKSKYQEKVHPLLPRLYQEMLCPLNKRDYLPVTGRELKSFLASLSEKYEDWKLKQSDDALRLFNYFLAGDKMLTHKYSQYQSQWEKLFSKMI